MRDMFQAGLRPAVARLYDPFDSFIARMGSVRRARDGGEREKHGPRMPGAGGVALRSLLRAPQLLNEAIDALGGRVFRGATLIVIFEAPGERGRRRSWREPRRFHPGTAHRRSVTAPRGTGSSTATG